MKLIGELDREVLQHLAADDGVTLEISIEISATHQDGFSDDTIRTVSENSTRPSAVTVASTSSARLIKTAPGVSNPASRRSATLTP